MDDLTSDRPDRAPTHPGAIWRKDILPALGLTVAGAARDLGVSRQALHNVLRREHPRTITPEMALRFARLCGDDALAGLWLRMQAAYSLWQASERSALHCDPQPQSQRPGDPYRRGEERVSDRPRRFPGNT